MWNHAKTNGLTGVGGGDDVKRAKQESCNLSQLWNAFNLFLFFLRASAFAHLCLRKLERRFLEMILLIFQASLKAIWAEQRRLWRWALWGASTTWKVSLTKFNILNLIICNRPEIAQSIGGFQKLCFPTKLTLLHYLTTPPPLKIVKQNSKACPKSKRDVQDLKQIPHTPKKQKQNIL